MQTTTFEKLRAWVRGDPARQFAFSWHPDRNAYRVVIWDPDHIIEHYIDADKIDTPTDEPICDVFGLSIEMWNDALKRNPKQ